MSSREEAPLVAFRTTSGPAIGFGHLRRCLTLAEELLQVGLRCHFFLTGDRTGVAIARRAGFEADLLDDADPGVTRAALRAHAPAGLVVDDYSVTAGSFRQWRAESPLLVAIDDLAERTLEVDVLLDSGLGATSRAHETGRDCTKLLGPSYALLRPPFRNAPRRAISAKVTRVLVTLGGSDPGGQTEDVVQRLTDLYPEVQLDVVVGPFFKNDLSSHLVNVAVHRSPSDLSPLMSGSDLAICGGGQTVYELAALGVPAIALCLAENQRSNLSALAALPTLLAVSDGAALEQAVQGLIDDPALRRQMARNGQSLVDGNGAIRVAQVLREQLGSLEENRRRKNA